VSNTLAIPDQVYQDAANAVWQVRRNPQPTVSLDLIGKEIRSYVYAGQNKLLQQDYASNLSDALKNILYNTVQSALYNQYGTKATPVDISLTLQALETQAMQGLASQQILKPLKSEIDWEATIDAAHAKDPGFFDYLVQGVNKFFSWIGSLGGGAIGSAINGLAAGLGLDPSILYLGLAALAFFVFIR
jgi:hypothetical protein